MNSKPAALSSLLQSEAKYCHVLFGGSSATTLKNTTKVTHHPLLCSQNPQKGSTSRSHHPTIMSRHYPKCVPSKTQKFQVCN